MAAAGVAGLAVGAMAGAAVAKSSQPSSTTVVVEQARAAPAAMPIGAQMTNLPGNCASSSFGGQQYYVCGSNWFKPYFGSGGVYYQVVPAP